MPRVKKEIIAKETKKTAVKKSAGLSVPTFDLQGKESGTMELPQELFGGKINKPLLAQAIRVYLNNQKAHYSNTKTRSEVKYSTRKIRTQKGTGGARHGSLRAPIFVGGGIALGPKFRKISLVLPKKMKRAALISALSAKVSEKEVFGITGWEKISGKTSGIKNLMDKIAKKNVLLVSDGKNENIIRAARNLSGIKISTSSQLNALTITSSETLILTKEAVEKLGEKAAKK